MNQRPTYFQCPRCNFMHSAAVETNLLCSQRGAMTYGSLDRKHGSEGWDEIRADEVAAWREGVTHQQERTTS